MNNSSRNDISSIYGAVGLKMARAALGFSQEEMAKLIGISKVTLARIETLESSPSLGTFLKAIKILESLGIELTLNGEKKTFVDNLDSIYEYRAPVNFFPGVLAMENSFCSGVKSERPSA